MNNDYFEIVDVEVKDAEAGVINLIDYLADRYPADKINKWVKQTDQHYRRAKELKTAVVDSVKTFQEESNDKLLWVKIYYNHKCRDGSTVSATSLERLF